MNEYRPTFFIVKNRALGDSIMGLASISYLRKMYPKSTIIYAIPQWTAKLYQNISTDADMIYSLKMDSISDILNLYTDLLNLKVDVIHEMHQTGTGHKVFGLFGLLKNIPYSFHNHHLEKPTKVIDQGCKIELIQRDLDGVYSYYGKKSNRPHFLNFEPSFLIQTAIKKVNRIIFGVVATRATKMWPLDNYLELAKLILNANTDYKISIPLSNSKEDRRIKDELMSKIQDSRIEIVNLPLCDLPQYFLESKFYIGNDTGLKHLAVAANLSSITLFGPEPIREWHPYDTKKHAAFFIENLPCRTRIHHYCGLSICDLKGEDFMKCMKGISIQEVFNKVNLLCK